MKIKPSISSRLQAPISACVTECRYYIVIIFPLYLGTSRIIKKLFRGITVDNPLSVWLLNFLILALTLSLPHFVFGAEKWERDVYQEEIEELKRRKIALLDEIQSNLHQLQQVKQSLTRASGELTQKNRQLKEASRGLQGMSKTCEPEPTEDSSLRGEIERLKLELERASLQRELLKPEIREVSTASSSRDNEAKSANASSACNLVKLRETLNQIILAPNIENRRRLTSALLENLN